MTLPGSDEQHAVALSLAILSPAVVWQVVGPGAAIAYAALALAVVAVTVAVVRVRGRRAFLRFLWSRLPRGRRRLPTADPTAAPARAGDRP